MTKGRVNLPGGAADLLGVNLNDAKNERFQQRHSRESENPERKTGFRVKPGMTDLKVLRK